MLKPGFEYKIYCLQFESGVFEYILFEKQSLYIIIKDCWYENNDLFINYENAINQYFIIDPYMI